MPAFDAKEADNRDDVVQPVHQVSRRREIVRRLSWMAIICAMGVVVCAQAGSGSAPRAAAIRSTAKAIEDDPLARLRAELSRHPRIFPVAREVVGVPAEMAIRNGVERCLVDRICPRGRDRGRRAPQTPEARRARIVHWRRTGAIVAPGDYLFTLEVGT